MNNNRKISTERNDKDRIELAAAAAKNSDKLAFVELIGIFSPYISALARSFGLPESEYDDLCQVGRIALYRRFARIIRIKRRLPLFQEFV